MKKKVTVTTADVARRAGLSKMTVSRVLNDHPYVTDETRSRVMKAVEELGFTPNTLAKRFFTGKTQLIGLIMPVEYIFSSHYFKDLFRGVMECLEERSYDLLLHDSKSKRIAPVDKSRTLVKGRLVDGLLVVAPMSHDEYPSALTEEGIPLVVMGETMNPTKVFRVGIPNRKSSADAVARLIELGHRHIGMLTFDGGHIEAYQRTRGYQDALKKAEISVSLVGVGHYQRREAYEETMRLLREHPEITALFSANAEMTMGTVDALKELGRSIPGDISLLAFDDCEEFEQVDPPLTSVRQFPYKIGFEAAKMLVEILEAKTVEKPRQKIIPTEFVERGS
ncbi:MAG: LacI family transcriptional regulator, partial [Spartobacteria bacterium]|nr:LacI family transcriptional regulator [Spartobacteria bacterium]